MAEFDVEIYACIEARNAEEANERIDRALDRAFPADRKYVHALSWSAAEEADTAPLASTQEESNGAA